MTPYSPNSKHSEAFGKDRKKFLFFLLLLRLILNIAAGDMTFHTNFRGTIGCAALQTRVRFLQKPRPFTPLWLKGPDFNGVTQRNALRHRSGFRSLIGLLIWLAASSASVTAEAHRLDFHLLTWAETDSNESLPSATGRKPSASYPTAGDWLVLTGDDETLSAAYNPLGALSHNFADLIGVAGASFNMVPSLSGSLTLELSDSGPNAWSVAVSGLDYTGQATPVMQMNQQLVAAGSPVAANSQFLTDGLGNSGTWSGSAGGNWAIQYQLDFYFATGADGDPAMEDADAAFNDKLQTGHLIPVEQLTPAGLAGVTLDDPTGFHAGDFKQYLLDEIKPRLPGDATYLLVTQMAKTHPDYAEPGLPITTGGFIGNTTIAYSRDSLAPLTAPSLSIQQLDALSMVLRWETRNGLSYQLYSSGSMAAGTWEPVGDPVSGTGAFAEVGVPITVARKFFRVEARKP